MSHLTAYDHIVSLCDDDISLIDDSSGVTQLREHPSRLDLVDSPDLDIHRKFHVIYEGADPWENQGGAFVATQDNYLLLTVQVAFFEGGGDLHTYSDRKGIDRLAMDDMNRLRYHLTHPDNRDGTVIHRVDWENTRRTEKQPGANARIYEMGLRVWVRETVLS